MPRIAKRLRQSKLSIPNPQNYDSVSHPQEASHGRSGGRLRFPPAFASLGSDFSVGKVGNALSTCFSQGGLRFPSAFAPSEPTCRLRFPSASQSDNLRVDFVEATKVSSPWTCLSQSEASDSVSHPQEATSQVIRRKTPFPSGFRSLGSYRLVAPQEAIAACLSPKEAIGLVLPRKLQLRLPANRQSRHGSFLGRTSRQGTRFSTSRLASQGSRKLPTDWKGNMFSFGDTERQVHSETTQVCRPQSLSLTQVRFAMPKGKGVDIRMKTSVEAEGETESSRRRKAMPITQGGLSASLRQVVLTSQEAFASRFRNRSESTFSIEKTYLRIVIKLVKYNSHCSP